MNEDINEMLERYSKLKDEMKQVLDEYKQFEADTKRIIEVRDFIQSFGSIEQMEKCFNDLKSELYILKTVLNTKEAMKFLGIGKSTMYKMTSENEIPFSSPRGSKFYFKRQDLEEWMLQNRTPSRYEMMQDATAMNMVMQKAEISGCHKNKNGKGTVI